MKKTLGGLGLSLVVLAGVPAAANAQAQVVIDPFSGGLVNSYSISPTFSGNYWDNYSADGTYSGTTPVISDCNIGFYALGTIDPGCIQAIGPAGSTYANSQIRTYGWAPFVPSVTNSPSFEFSAGNYNITLLGGYHGSQSNLWTYGCGGIFGTGCGLMDYLSEYSVNENVGYTYNLNYAGLVNTWGFYYDNSFNPTTGCNGVGTACTGINSGTALPTLGRMDQFWAVFQSNSACTWGYYCYLVGAEDNELNYIAPGVSYKDADYQDWILSVTATPEPGSMALLATGLVALSGAGLIKRRRRNA